MARDIDHTREITEIACGMIRLRLETESSYAMLEALLPPEDLTMSPEGTDRAVTIADLAKKMGEPDMRESARVPSSLMAQGPDRILKFFEYSHLPHHLAQISMPFALLAQKINAEVAPGPERTVALRKLLEGKDAAVRAVLHPGG